MFRGAGHLPAIHNAITISIKASELVNRRGIYFSDLSIILFNCAEVELIA
jgi:hypothetical protein